MASYTTNYNLKKPDRVDFIAIQDLNDNADTIDTTILAEKQSVMEWAKGTFRNDNQLINADFQVWLKGVGLTGTGSKLFWQLVGGWFCYAATSSNIFEKVTNGIKLTTMTAGYSARLGQYLKYNKNLSGKTVTITVKASSMVGTLQIYQTDNGTNTYLGQLSADGVKSITFTYPTGTTNCGIFVQTSGTVGDTATIEWGKLEMGSIATPFIPKPYVIELQDCLMYDTNGEIIPPYINPNLLINGNFLNPINQRGQTTYSIASGGIYTIDRWRLQSWDTSTATLTLDNGLLISYSGAYKADLRYYFTPSDTVDLYNKQVLLSFEIEILSGSLNSVQVGRKESPYTSYVWGGPITASGKYSFVGTILDATTLMVVFTTATNVATSFRLKWVKLELGYIATPLAPRDDELQRCQKYARPVSVSNQGARLIQYTSSTLEFHIPITVTMRTVAPTIDTSTFSVRAMGSSTNIAGFTFAVTAFDTHIRIVATKTSHGLTDAALVIPYGLLFDNEIY